MIRKQVWPRLFLLLAPLAAASAGHAQIKVNGSVTEPGPLWLPDDVYEVTLSIWTEPVGGEFVSERRYPDVHIRDGRLPPLTYRVPTDRDVSGLWLEVLVDGNAVADRAQLSSVSGEAVSLESGSLDFWNSTVSTLVPFASLDTFFAGTTPYLILRADHGGEIRMLTGTGVRTVLRESGLLEVRGGTEASLSAGSGYLMVGEDDSKNLVFDGNEIQARNWGNTDVLHLNYEGGAVKVGTTIIGNSDARLKEDIRDLDEGMDEVLRLRPVSFAWRREPGERRFGLVGQEVREVVGEVVYESEDGMLGIAYQNLVPLLIRALQDQQTEIDRLRSDLETLRSQIAGG